MQTAEQLIDRLTIALFNADHQGQVTIDKSLVQEIGIKLRLLVDADDLTTQAARMHLSPRESRIWHLLASQPDVPVALATILAYSDNGTENSLCVHKRRLVVKLRRHHAGDIVCVRDYGYMYTREP